MRNRQLIEDRFWPKVDRRGDDECWPWLAAASGSSTRRSGRRDPKISVHKDDCERLGIPTMAVESSPIIRAIRIAWALAVGGVPDGFELHHTCENPMCVNPGHLACITHDEHILLHHGERCTRGHLRSENRYPSGRRGCRECERTKQGRKLVLV